MKLNIEDVFKAYKYSYSLTKSYDKLILSEALNSYYYSINNYITTEESYNKIIKLIERKNKLINFKIKMDKILKNIDKTFRAILIQKYIKNFSAESIADNLNLSLRTYFRRLEKAEATIINKLS